MSFFSNERLFVAITQLRLRFIYMFNIWPKKKKIVQHWIEILLFLVACLLSKQRLLRRAMNKSKFIDTIRQIETHIFHIKLKMGVFFNAGKYINVDRLTVVLMIWSSYQWKRMREITLMPKGYHVSVYCICIGFSIIIQLLTWICQIFVNLFDVSQDKYLHKHLVTRELNTSDQDNTKTKKTKHIANFFLQ